jgi:hypothetical protein
VATVTSGYRADTEIRESGRVLGRSGSIDRPAQRVVAP